MGPDFFLAKISVDFEVSISVDTVETVFGEMDRSIKQQFPEVNRIFIEAEKRKS